MKKRYKMARYHKILLTAGLTTAALLVGTQAFALHTDNIPLLNAAGTAIGAGEAYSAKETCGACHDYNAIEAHSFHAQLGANEHKGWNPNAYGNMNSVASKGKPWVQSTGHVGKW